MKIVQIRLSAGTRLRFTVAVALSGFCFQVAAADLKPSVPERAAKVRTELNSTDIAVRQAAIKSLVHSDLSEGLNAEIQRSLKDEDGMVRSTAATAVGNLGSNAVSAVEQLVIQVKADAMKEARETAARALGRIGKAVPDAKGKIVPALELVAQKDSDAVTRVVALGALSMLEVAPKEQIGLIRKYLHHDETLVRMKASHALGMLGVLAKEAGPEIVEVLKRETDDHRRGYVARALGNTGDPASLPALEEALKRETDAGAQGEMRGAIKKLTALLPVPAKP